jgi:hypothetical protein
LAARFFLTAEDAEGKAEEGMKSKGRREIDHRGYGGKKGQEEEEAHMNSSEHCRK